MIERHFCSWTCRLAKSLLRSEEYREQGGLALQPGRVIFLWRSAERGRNHPGFRSLRRNGIDQLPEAPQPIDVGHGIPFFSEKTAAGTFWRRTNAGARDTI
jgi:hypothetical protein